MMAGSTLSADLAVSINLRSFFGCPNNRPTIGSIIIEAPDSWKLPNEREARSGRKLQMVT